MLRVISLENVLPHIVLVRDKTSVGFNQKGWQFSCHLITSRNVEDLSPENVYFILFEYENKCKVIPKGMAVQLPPNNW